MIIGIHSPEFDFEKVTKNVEAAVKRDDVTWPVALDSDMAIWNKFQNNSWPADYIADQTGHIRYTSVGEGGYDTHRERDPRAARCEGDLAASRLQGDAFRRHVDPEQQPRDLPRLAVPGPDGAADRDPAAARTTIHRFRSARSRRRCSGRAVRSRSSPDKPEGALEGKWTADNEAVTADAHGLHDPARCAREGSEPRDGDRERAADRRGGRARRSAGSRGRSRARACTSTATAAPS